MAKISFETLRFREMGENVEAEFLRIFSFTMLKKELEVIGKLYVGDDFLEFEGAEKKRAESMLNISLAKGFQNLRNNVTGKRSVYVHRKSGIPIIGNVAFGIVDRNTSIVEIKPVTACNLKCIYCSVNDDERPVDFVVEREYIVEELKSILDYKECEGIEVHIGGQAEPLFYADLAGLVKDVSGIRWVSEISIDTNATMLTKEKVDKLVEAGITRFNLSINALSQELAESIAGAKYSLKHSLDIADYIAEKASLIIAPVWMKNVNDNDIEGIVMLVKKLRKKSKKIVLAGIQNFLKYRLGRNPVKQMSWEEFMKKLKKLENEHGEHLILDPVKDFNIRKTKPIQKPFRKGNIIEAEIMCSGRLKGESIAASSGRSISLMNCKKQGKVKIRITGDKHNIFHGVCI